MNTKNSEHGQALILIAIAMAGLIAITGLALDSGNAFANRRAAQNAADTSAMAAALAKVSGQDWYDAGFARAETNNFYNDGINSTVEIYSPPVEGLYAGDADYLQVIITATVQTWFSSIVGVNEITNRVSAVARAEPSSIQPLYYGNAVVALSQSGCHNVKSGGSYGGIWFHGNSQINVVGSGIFSNSNDPNCALALDGNTSVFAPEIDLVGGSELPNNCDAIHGFPCTNGTPPIGSNSQFPYPPNPNIYPAFACDTASNAEINGTTISTGGEDIVQVNQDFPPAGVTKIDPGIYCVMEGNNFRNNGNDELTGSGVTIIVLGGDITFNGSGTISIQAPTTGDNKGLAIYVPPGYESDININGTADSNITGTILAPESSCEFSGNELGGYQGQLICWNIGLGGNGDTTVSYEEDQNYETLSPAVIELVQ
jgi:Flp pilus assembly protein TadG